MESLPWWVAALAGAVAILPLVLPLARRAAHAAGWRARDGEIAQAQQTVAAAQARAAELAERLAACEAQRDALREARSALEAEAARSGEVLAQAERRLARLEEVEAHAAATSGELAGARMELASLRAQLAAAQQQAEERRRLLEDASERFRGEFQALAATLLDERARSFAEQSQAQLGALLSPLREQLDAFKRTVLETYDREMRERLALGHQLADLRELNSRLGQEAQELTRALKGDTRAQGAWGELLLERLLESAGLEAGIAYTLQASTTGAEGDRQRPDALIHLPDQRDLVIDAKVSLVAFERWCNATDADARAQALKAHVASIREHVRSLSERRYAATEGLRTLDYVLMFVPVEAAFIEAVRADEGLYRYALERNVALVTPATLLVTLRTVASLWANEKRSRNVEEIARRAGLLYDKFVGFVDDMQALRRQLDQAQRAWGDAWNKLADGRGNLVAQAEELRRLGARVNKALPAGVVETAGESGAAAPTATAGAAPADPRPQ